MRLVNADEFIETARGVLDMQDLYLPIHFKEFVIDEMPTVEAIPIEWMLKWDETLTDESMEIGRTVNWNIVKWMILEWKKDNG